MQVCRTIIDGRERRYLTFGDGPPVLLLHAFPFRAEFWHPQFDPSLRCRVIAPDLRGFGGSSRVATRDGVARDEPATSMEDYARDVVQLLDALDIESAVVCGLSMGGYVAFALHRLAASRIRALVLADTRAESDTEEGRRGRQAMLAALAERGAVAVADAMMPRMLSPVTRRDNPSLDSEVRTMMQSAPPDALADAIRSLMDRPDVSSELPGIRVPVQLIVGRDDEVTPVALHERMFSLLPDASLTVLESAGHLASLERPEAFNRTLERFLKGLSWQATAPSLELP